MDLQALIEDEFKRWDDESTPTATPWGPGGVKAFAKVVAQRAMDAAVAEREADIGGKLDLIIDEVREVNRLRAERREAEVAQRLNRLITDMNLIAQPVMHLHAGETRLAQFYAAIKAATWPTPKP